MGIILEHVQSKKPTFFKRYIRSVLYSVNRCISGMLENSSFCYQFVFIRELLQSKAAQKFPSLPGVDMFQLVL